MGLEIVAQMIAGIGAAARSAAADLTAAADAAAAYNAAASSTGAMSANQGGNASTLKSSTSDLGDPRDAEGQAMRMYAAIEAAKRGR